MQAVACIINPIIFLALYSLSSCGEERKTCFGNRGNKSEGNTINVLSSIYLSLISNNQCINAPVIIRPNSIIIFPFYSKNDLTCSTNLKRQIYDIPSARYFPHIYVSMPLLHKQWTLLFFKENFGVILKSGMVSKSHYFNN